jgi:hypothetical protein
LVFQFKAQALACKPKLVTGVKGYEVVGRGLARAIDLSRQPIDLVADRLCGI